MAGAFFITAQLIASASAQEVEVFTDRQHPVTSVDGLRIVELDAPARLEATLAAKLPSNPKQASAIVRQRLRDSGSELQRQSITAYQGITQAWALGITKIPAVVVDRRYVIYGESDVARAVTRINAYRNAKP